MTHLSRRRFVQLLGAAGLAPLLPAIPARAVVASGGTSASKALWASLYANSGSTAEFVGLAKNMGLSNTAIQGIGARSIGVRMSLAAVSEKVAYAGKKTVGQALPSPSTKLKSRPSIKQILENLLSDETDDEEALVDEKESKNLVGENLTELQIQKNL